VHLGLFDIRLSGSDPLAKDAVDRVLGGWSHGPGLAPRGVPVRVRLEGGESGQGANAEVLVHGPFAAPGWFASLGRLWKAWGEDGGAVRVACDVSAPAVTDLALTSFLRFLVAEAAARSGGLAFHACAVARPDGAALLLARSDGGKTTFARTFGHLGVIGDDYCVVAPLRGRLWVFPTPFRGREGTPVSSPALPLWRAAELVKSDRVTREPLRGSDAVVAVLRHVLLFSMDRSLRLAVLETAARVASEGRMARLWFGLRDDPWKVLDGD